MNGFGWPIQRKANTTNFKSPLINFFVRETRANVRTYTSSTPTQIIICTRPYKANFDSIFWYKAHLHPLQTKWCIMTRCGFDTCHGRSTTCGVQIMVRRYPGTHSWKIEVPGHLCSFALLLIHWELWSAHVKIHQHGKLWRKLGVVGKLHYATLLPVFNTCSWLDKETLVIQDSAAKTSACARIRFQSFQRLHRPSLGHLWMTLLRQLLLRSEALVW